VVFREGDGEFAVRLRAVADRDSLADRQRVAADRDGGGGCRPVGSEDHPLTAESLRAHEPGTFPHGNRAVVQYQVVDEPQPGTVGYLQIHIQGHAVEQTGIVRTDESQRGIARGCQSAAFDRALVHGQRDTQLEALQIERTTAQVQGPGQVDGLGTLVDHGAQVVRRELTVERQLTPGLDNDRALVPPGSEPGIVATAEYHAAGGLQGPRVQDLRHFDFRPIARRGPNDALIHERRPIEFDVGSGGLEDDIRADGEGRADGDRHADASAVGEDDAAASSQRLVAAGLIESD